MESITQLPSRYFAKLKAQWSNPQGILELLLIVGGDVVQTALAQMGGRDLTPVGFSFGWAAYAFMSVSSVVGEGRLMPLSDHPSIVINGLTGYARNNESWILGRILRDYEDGHWRSKDVSEAVKKVLEGKGGPKGGLCVSFFEAKGSEQPMAKKKIGEPVTERTRTGLPQIRPEIDCLWYLGWFVIVCQLSLSIVPWAVYEPREWPVFVITLCGTAIALITGGLNQWREERWSSRLLDKERTYILTRGNGAQYALVIIAREGSLNLEDLATSSEGKPVSRATKLWMVFCLLFWVALLLTVGGIESNTWYLVGIGGAGTLYSVYVAGVGRKPENYGIKLEPYNVTFEEGKPRKHFYISPKVMMTLIGTERACPGVGLAMLSTFFPGTLSKKEQAAWDRAREFISKKTSGSNAEVDKAAEQLDQLSKLRIQGLEDKLTAESLTSPENSQAEGVEKAES